MGSRNRGEMMKLIKRIDGTPGFRVERTKSGHWKVTGLAGMTVLSFSPKARGTAQTMKQLAQIGWPPK